MRSKLFVPGSRAELFPKALISEADAISFDLEDSVPEDAKASARARLAEFLRSDLVRRTDKVIIVRVNAVESVHFEQDLLAFACREVQLLNLPKAQCAADVRSAATSLQRAERRNGVEQPIPLLVNIETSRAFRLAAEIADAHPRVAGLQLGLADMFEALQINRQDPSTVHAAMFAVRMAAGERGRFAYDSAFPDVFDEEGFRREARQARGLGYVGKSCIHPTQVPWANDVFATDELTPVTARRIVAAAKEAAEVGRGAFLLDGRMIDLPALKRAQAMLADANEGQSS
jgi:citrate lyase subunit beta/citryl-CoA lyase